MSSIHKAAEAAWTNLAKAEDYLKTMTEALEDAKYRERIARSLRDEAREALQRAEAAEARTD